MASTIIDYLRAASAWFTAAVGIFVPITSASTGKLLPQFEEFVSLIRRWQQPRKKREPYTEQMFIALYTLVRQRQGAYRYSFLDHFAAVFDWVRLGIFTGSRGIEYCQTTARRHTFTRVPRNPVTADFGGLSLAFMSCDFSFYTEDMHLIPHHSLFSRADHVAELHIRFRYDKGPTNFSIRKFRRSSHLFLCPVRAAISIMLRAATLGVPADEPLAVFVPDPKLFKKLPIGRSYTFLKSSDVISVMRESVRLAYPDEHHYLRIHLDRIDCHSNRVTAAVALSLAGLTEEAIAFRLRWNPMSVKHYLRECTREIGITTAATIRGYFKI